MDLGALMTQKYLEQGHDLEVEVVRICPPYRHRFARWKKGPALGLRRNVDRLLNRFFDYPRFLKKLVRHERFDIYHIIDHSYSQLVKALPSDRVVVTCWDLDTFRCLLRPDLEPRPAWFRGLTRKILEGLQAARLVIPVSESTRAAILEHGLIPDDRMLTIYPGTNPEFGIEPHSAADNEAARLLGPIDPEGPIDLLHVGSNIPRKRVEVLLETFAGVRRAIPRARLVKIGGAFTAAQAEQIKALGLESSILVIPFVGDRTLLAAIYRRVALVLQPSEAEGFGFPLVEAMACGAPLLATDLTVLREVAGDGAVFAPLGDVSIWTETAIRLIQNSQEQTAGWQSQRALGLARARLFRWEVNAFELVKVYKAMGFCD
jgi:glycosyltransferase involved in cell wall biosynthesis